MHLSLYRKYRPKVFSDVVGQEHITTILQKEVESGKIHHAYIFTGSRGTGKTTCAKILAKAINCEAPENGNPCTKCDMCKDIESGAVLDIVEIDAASNTGVDNIRDLKEEAMFTPARGKYRVFIIDEVHMLSQSAFNALLKILEEPPAHVVFILATTEVDEVLPTVLSRCQRFDFKRITADKISERLKFVADSEGFEIEPDAAALIAKISEGALRDALSILEQCSVYSDKIDKETVLKAAGIAGREYVTAILERIADNDLAECLNILAGLYENGKNLLSFIEEIALAFRDVMVMKCSDKCKDILSCMPDEIPFYEQYAASVSMDFVFEKLSVLKDGLDGVEKSFNERVFAELMLVRLCGGADVFNAKASVSEEKKPADKKPGAPDKTAAPKAAPSPAPQTAPAPENGRTEFTAWNDVVAALAEKNPMLASFLDGSEALADSESLYILTGNEFFHKMIRSGDSAAVLSSAVEQVTGKRYKLKVSAMPKKETENPLDSLIKRAEEEGIKVNVKD